MLKNMDGKPKNLRLFADVSFAIVPQYPMRDFSPQPCLAFSLHQKCSKWVLLGSLGFEKAFATYPALLATNAWNTGALE